MCVDTGEWFRLCAAPRPTMESSPVVDETSTACNSGSTINKTLAGPRACNIWASVIAALWSDDVALRSRSVVSLAYGNLPGDTSPRYSTFGPMFVRYLHKGHPKMPDDISSATLVVRNCLRDMLKHQCLELRGMANMNYSFLSGSLYLNVLSTCRDIIHSIARMEAHEAQQELFTFITTLMEPAVAARVNKEDARHLTSLASSALAGMSGANNAVLADTSQWYSPAQQACLVSVLIAMSNRRAAPFAAKLLRCHSHPKVRYAAADALGRIGTTDEITDLLLATKDQCRPIRVAARLAIQRIKFRHTRGVAQHLLRPAVRSNDEPLDMLRPLPAHQCGELPADR